MDSRTLRDTAHPDRGYRRLTPSHTSGRSATQQVRVQTQEPHAQMGPQNYCFDSQDVTSHKVARCASPLFKRRMTMANMHSPRYVSEIRK